MTTLTRVLRAGGAVALFGGLFAAGWWCCFLTGALAGKGGLGVRQAVDDA